VFDDAPQLVDDDCRGEEWQEPHDDVCQRLTRSGRNADEAELPDRTSRDRRRDSRLDVAGASLTLRVLAEQLEIAGTGDAADDRGAQPPGKRGRAEPHEVRVARRAEIRVVTEMIPAVGLDRETDRVCGGPVGEAIVDPLVGVKGPGCTLVHEDRCAGLDSYREQEGNRVADRRTG